VPPSAVLFLATVLTTRLTAPFLAQESGGKPEGFLDQFPWLGDFTAAVLGIGLLCLLVYFLRPGGGGVADFSIEVEGDDVNFKGRFPAEARGAVEDFLVNDCRIQGAYEVLGKWEQGRLVVTVRGDAAKLLEQRIRNFLKLNVKRAGQ